MMNIFCVACQKKVEARLTNGAEVYPHRPDLYKLNFWICDNCKNFVGCHKNGNGKKPLGNIPTPKIKMLRKQIHSQLDPLWQSGKYSRKWLYKTISKKIGKEYHTATIASVEEAKTVLNILSEIKNEKTNYPQNSH